MKKEITNGKLTIILDDKMIAKVKADAKDIAADIASGKEPFFNCNDKKYLEAVDELCSLADKIMNEYPSLDIFKYLPLTKAGFFPRRGILIANTNVKWTWNYEYFSQRILQLRLIPTHWYDDNNTEFQFWIEEGLSKVEPVFDEHRIPHIIHPTKPTKYLKDKDIIPGRIYAEKNGTEYFYFGYYDIHHETPYASDPKEISAAETELMKGPVRPYPQHFYLRVTKKARKIIDSYTNLQDLLDECVKSDMKLSCRCKPRQFVEEKETVFTSTSVTKHTVYGKITHYFQVIYGIIPFTYK